MKRILKNKGARTGVFFGATSGVITTVGLIVGLYAGTESVVAVLGGILVIAVADAMSDALGIHIAQEADPESTSDHIWAATFSTFFDKVRGRDQLRCPSYMAAVTDGRHRFDDLGSGSYRLIKLFPRQGTAKRSLAGHP